MEEEKKDPTVCPETEEGKTAEKCEKKKTVKKSKKIKSTDCLML